MLAILFIAVVTSHFAHSQFVPARFTPRTAPAPISPVFSPRQPVRSFAPTSSFISSPSFQPVPLPLSPPSRSAFPLTNVPLRPAVFPQPTFAPVTRTFIRDPEFAPVSTVQPQIGLVERTQLQDDSGQFTSTYRLTDGQSFSETGELHPTNDHLDNVVVKRGSYGWTSPEGIPVQITYVADEYGFHPEGTAIPVAVQAQPPVFL